MKRVLLCAIAAASLALPATASADVQQLDPGHRISVSFGHCRVYYEHGYNFGAYAKTKQISGTCDWGTRVQVYSPNATTQPCPLFGASIDQRCSKSNGWALSFLQGQPLQASALRLCDPRGCMANPRLYVP